MKTTTTEESLTGLIERVTFHSEETGFAVLRVKVNGQRDLVTVVGNLANVSAGEYLDCQGSWFTDREYGLQFKATQIRVAMPSTLEGIQKYLGSGLIKGVGPHFAKQLVEAFGQEVFDIIESEPNRLMELPGIGQGRRDKVIESWQDQKIIRKIMVFLQSHGVGTARAVRIYKTYGDKAIEVVQQNPYRLAHDIRGIGFKTADVLATRLGIPKDSLVRAQAGIRHVLQEHCDSGHCAMGLEALINTSVEILDIPEKVIEEAIDTQQKEKTIFVETSGGEQRVFPANLYHAELGVIRQLDRLLSQRVDWMSSVDTHIAIGWVEKKTQLELSRTQKEALRVALKNKVVIITGGPGVGKTTLVNSILTFMKTKVDKIMLAAPTGRAAKRLSESAQLEAKTLHRLLEFDPKTYQFRHNEDRSLDADYVVVDEVSMVDITMMHHLLKAIPDQAVLLLVGDVDQLPSVGSGAVLSDLIQSDKIPTVCLTEIFRQAKTSQIIVNAHRVNQGYMPKLESEPDGKSDFYFIPGDTPEEIQEKLLHVVVQRIPKRFSFDPIKDIQVLVPMNRGGLGARALNILLQQKLNPKGKHPVVRFGNTYAEGDKVIQTVNNYQREVFNGDIGHIQDIDTEEGLVKVSFDERVVEYDLSDLDELSLAYATTIHKAQGSEYPVVVMPIAMQHFMLLEKNLLYTGITRGKSLVVIIGQKKALGMAVKTLRSNQRMTGLLERLEALKTL